ncbi:putative N-acetylmannosamine-6-phosphate 2-epimerase [Saccharopolyspora cebuensis]|uniref:N-acylglucosamine-6-phosphate 2-epimerase n=1 Tax=Saccharopolyspora cebuensis TaxID=418759 RepID=A0ABV4CFN0_9PSEU
MKLSALLSAITGRLIVSCQASEGHALRHTGTLARVARAAADGRAAAIRCGGVGGVADVTAVAEAVDVPVIGLTKSGREGVFITPTVEAARSVAATPAAVVALDGTARPRPDGSALRDGIAAVHELGKLAMADVSTAAEGIAAADAGADLVATTLSGYTPNSRRTEGPDLALVGELAAALPEVPIVAEGRYHAPEQAAEAIRAGAASVVVGTAITDPTWITRSFAEAVTTAGGEHVGR